MGRSLAWRWAERSAPLVIAKVGAARRGREMRRRDVWRGLAGVPALAAPRLGSFQGSPISVAMRMLASLVPGTRRALLAVRRGVAGGVGVVGAGGHGEVGRLLGVVVSFQV